jgi:hypothetical protein
MFKAIKEVMSFLLTVRVVRDMAVLAIYSKVIPHC